MIIPPILNLYYLMKGSIFRAFFKIKYQMDYQCRLIFTALFGRYFWPWLYVYIYNIYTYIYIYIYIYIYNGQDVSSYGNCTFVHNNLHVISALT